MRVEGRLQKCVLVLDPCNLYSLAPLLGGLFSFSKLGARGPPRSSCFHRLHLTRSISAYTEKALRVIFFARHEASQYGNRHIEKEHLLLGLFREDQRLAQKLLEKHVRCGAHPGSCKTHLHRAGMGQDCRKNRRCPIRRQPSGPGDPGLGSARKTGETESRLCSHDCHSDSEAGRLDDRASSSHRSSPNPVRQLFNPVLRLSVLEPPLASRAAKVPESGPVP
jgi:hypothetical protein